MSELGKTSLDSSCSIKRQTLIGCQQHCGGGGGETREGENVHSPILQDQMVQNSMCEPSSAKLSCNFQSQLRLVILAGRYSRYSSPTA